MRRGKAHIGFLSKFLVFLNALAVFFLLLSYLAPYINPASFWPIAFLGLAYPFILLFNLLCVVFWLFRKPVFAATFCSGRSSSAGIFLPVLSVLENLPPLRYPNHRQILCAL
jgi:hypothetical protein